LLELVETDFQIDDVRWARALAERLLSQFEDRERGGFYFTSHDHEELLYRPKTGHDNSTPSGNGVAAFALQRLGHLLGETRYIEAAERTLKSFDEATKRSPSGHTSLLGALEEVLVPPRIVVLCGAADERLRWHAHLAETYRPDALVASVPDGLADLPQTLRKETHEDCAPTAWVCTGTHCLAPITNLAELERLLYSDVSFT